MLKRALALALLLQENTIDELQVRLLPWQLHGHSWAVCKRDAGAQA